MTKDQGQRANDKGQRTKDFVDVERLCAESFVCHAEFFDTLGSTNNRAGELARQTGLPTPALVAARLQTAGRGRGTNAWWADEGALTFSLVLDTPQQGITPRDWPKLSLTTAVAVCDTLEGELSVIPQSTILNPHALLGIKWPNDVLIDGRKVCGILIESPGGAAPAKNRLVVGVGVNVNNSWQSAPSEAGPAGTAIADITGRQHDLQQVLLAVLRALESRLGQLVSGNPQLPCAWQQLDWLRGRIVSVQTGDRRTDGTCLRIADDGALALDTASGLQCIYSGTVRAL